jgi:hypothetical protein
MDGKNLITALAFLTVFATVWATILVAVLPRWSPRVSLWIFRGTGTSVLLSLIWVIVSFVLTPPAAVQRTLEQAAINITDRAIFRGKHWRFFGPIPKDFISVGGDSNTSIEDFTVVAQPEYMLAVPSTGTSQSMTTPKDFLRIKATNVANRLLTADPEGPEWSALQSDAKAIFGEVMRRLPPIKTNDVYIKYRTGYEAVCGLNYHPWIDRDYAHDAAIYLMILVEQLPPDTK